MILRLALGILIGVGIGSLTGYFGECTSGACPLTATPVRGGLYGGVLGLFFAMFLAAPAPAPSAGPPTRAVAAPASEPAAEEAGPARKAEPLVHIDSASEFEARVLKAKEPCLVDFYSNYCPPCRTLGPTIEKLAGDYDGRASICKVNLDRGKNADLAREYGISSIPTVLFFNDGKEVERYIGLRAEADYVAEMDRLLSVALSPATQENKPEPNQPARQP